MGFLNTKIKVQGKAGNLGEDIKVQVENDSKIVMSHISGVFHIKKSSYLSHSILHFFPPCTHYSYSTSPSELVASEDFENENFLYYAKGISHYWASLMPYVITLIKDAY